MDNFETHTLVIKSPRNLVTYDEVSTWLAGQLRQWRSYSTHGWSNIQEFRFVYGRRQQRYRATLVVEITIQDLFNSY